VVPILALGIPIADTLLAMGRRAFSGAPLFSADRGHIHHRLMDRGLTHRQAVLVIYGGAVLLALGALLLTLANSAQAALVLVAVAGLAFLALRALGFMNLSKVQAGLAQRRHNLEVRTAVRRAGEALRQAGTLEQVWQVVRGTAEPLGAVAVGLELGRFKGHAGAGPFSKGFEDAEGELLRARYGLVAERPGDDFVDFGWLDGRSEVDRDTEIAIELLCEHVVVALERIEKTLPASPAAPGKVIGLRR
jgi:UDP-GlcNAc:undecaprenyl-phosphate GlcNAc-1-phosphate transferase